MWFILSLALLAQTDATPAAPANKVAGTKVTAEKNAEKTAEKAAEKTAEKPTTEATENKKPAPEPSWLNDLLNTGAMKYMIDGGIFMWPILVLGVVAFGVIIERFRALMMLNTRAEELRGKVRELLEADHVEDALHLCDREQGPVPAILSAGLRKYLVARRLGYDAGKIEEQVIKGMDDYSVHIVAAMEKHLPILATVSSAAPMIGFLGTVSGMVTSFDDIVKNMGQMNIVEAAAGGIMVSLLTTVLGLVVGIPAYIAFNYFTSVINEFVLDVEESAAELIESVTLQLALAGKSNSIANN